VLDFRELLVWQKAHALVLHVYEASTHLPADERYGLTSQIRRSAASVPANIAEGCGRGSDSDLARFLQIAMGSASELEYHLLLVRDLGLIGENLYQALATEVIEVKRMLTGLINTVRRRASRHVDSDRRGERQSKAPPTEP